MGDKINVEIGKYNYSVSVKALHKSNMIKGIMEMTSKEETIPLMCKYINETNGEYIFSLMEKDSISQSDFKSCSMSEMIIYAHVYDYLDVPDILDLVENEIAARIKQCSNLDEIKKLFDGCPTNC